MTIGAIGAGNIGHGLATGGLLQQFPGGPLCVRFAPS
jgi:hypothetical protein